MANEANTFHAKFENVIVVHDGTMPMYEGDYNVIPTVTGKILLTKDKGMADDVIVEPISYIETDNDAGGKTISIAS